MVTTDDGDDDDDDDDDVDKHQEGVITRMVQERTVLSNQFVSLLLPRFLFFAQTSTLSLPLYLFSLISSRPHISRTFGGGADGAAPAPLETGRQAGRQAGGQAGRRAGGRAKAARPSRGIHLGAIRH